MSGGFLSRFRFRRNAEGSPAGPAEELEQSPGPPDDAMPDKVATPDLDAGANDVAMESLELSHEGLELDGEEMDASSTKLAQYAINGNSPAPEGDAVGVKFTLFQADGTPLRSEPGEAEDLATGGSSDDDAMAIEKVELSFEKVERVPASAGDGAPDFQDALITETGLPTPVAIPDPPPEDLGNAEPQGGSESNYEAWPAKWYVPELDSDASPPPVPEDMSTLEPIVESRETTGAINFLAAEQKTELFDDDGDSDPDDLA